MKKILISLFFLAYSGKFFAQINDNCINAIPLCSSPSFTFNANSGPGSIIDFSTTSTISNPVNNPFPPNSGCLKQGELNPQWLLITIGNAGLLEFVFGAANSANPQAGCYDWAMWPYSPSTCVDILNNTLAPIRCNWNGTCSNGTGIASAANYGTFGGNSTDFEPPLQVNACQQFIICISNYSGVNTLVSFQSLGTASLSCSPNCNPNYAICAGANATIVPVNYAALANPVFSIQPGGTSNTTGSFVVTPSVTSSYTTFITGLNSVNAVQTITSVSTVTVNAQPVAAPTLTQTTCTSSVNMVNLNLTFTPSATSPPSYTVNWSPIPNGVFNGSQTTFSGGIAPGLYNATVTTASGCKTTASFSIDPMPDPATIVLNPIGNSHTITCISDVTLTALNPAYNYTWTSIVAVLTGSSAVFTSTLVGNWVLTALNPLSNCTSTQAITIFQNTVPPTSVIGPTLQNITCSLTSVINVTASASPSVNITQQILAPQGGTYAVTSNSMIYTPGGIGTFTHCVVNDVNGCSTCKTFTVASTSGFPTFSVVSPQSFTLGCTSKSVAIINIVGAATSPLPGGPVSYTLLGPPTSSNTVPGPSLSTQSSYTVSVPGTWTVITMDNTNQCQTRVPISVLANTFAPNISAIVPRQILNCDEPKVVLVGQSLTNGVSYLWGFPGNPGSQTGDSLVVFSNSLTPTNSLVANYTLTITENNNTCKSNSVIPIYQNLFPPKAVISNGGTSALTCKIGTISLTNQSSTGIPTNTLFPNPLPVIGYIWEGPSPQETIQFKTTYIAGTAGVYTLTVKDLNNGCKSTATLSIGDKREYPIVNKPIAPPPFILDCGSNTVKISPIITGTTNSFTYAWTAPVAATISPLNTATLTANTLGNYRVLITNTINGCGSIAELSVINGSLNAGFEAQPSKGYAPLEVSFFNNSASTGSLGALNINSYWNYGNGTSSITTSNNLNPATTYSLPGIYKVVLFANKGTCIDSISRFIEVEVPSKMEVPNVFTPNGDNINDLFFLKASNLAEISILIYDRWGHKVYDLTSDKGNIAWDGKNQYGKEVAEGTYFYLIKAKGKDGQSYDKSGTVSLYR